jgi:hypothetical protein
MPLDQRSNWNQTESFVDTIDALQALVDEHGGIAPIKIVGDLNVKLPQQLSLVPGWHKTRGFNKHSSIMYDFISANDLIVADFIHKQSMNYTYFCDGSGVQTWIDHCLTSANDESAIINCQILPRDDTNVSDHLPILTTITLLCKTIADNNIKDTRRKCFPPAKWDNYANNQLYKVCLEHKLEQLAPFVIVDQQTIQSQIDSYVEDVNNAIHSAAFEAGCTRHSKYKPKPYWCPKLSNLRDRKRFWWRMWVDNGRPRTGCVFDCYKGVKKMFRRVFRQSVDNVMYEHYHKLQNLYTRRNMRSFWNELKRSRTSKTVSSLQADAFKTFYSGIMQESPNDNPINTKVSQNVDLYYKEHCSDKKADIIYPDNVARLIDKLRHNASPGIDGMTAEHLQYGKSDTLCTILASLYSVLLSYSCVPSTFTYGVIIPVIKKSTLNPNLPEHFRPITLTTMLAKMLEYILIPDAKISETQFGFRKGMGTAFGCRLLNDVMKYCEYGGSPLYTCSLDAEKCFDNICHKSLFYKLINVLPSHHWVLCYRWYSRLKATVKWQGNFSAYFNVTKGTRQGSILSPYFFNIFINDLLLDLQATNTGVAIGDLLINSFAYADDVTVINSTAKGLQTLIDKCYMYSQKWRFKFGIKKTKCMVVGNTILQHESKWYLGASEISNKQEIEILGTVFTKNGGCESHIDNRLRKCRQS